MTTRKRKAKAAPRPSGADRADTPDADAPAATDAPAAAGEADAGTADAGDAAVPSPAGADAPAAGTESDAEAPAPRAGRAGESPPPPARRGGAALAVVALVVALAAAGAAAYLWHQDRTVQSVRLQALDERAEALARRAEEIGARIDAARTGAADAAAAAAGLRERQAALEERVGRLAQEETRGRDAVALEEVRQLLLLANHRVRLAGDLDTAVAALKAADARLEAMGDPDLLAVRAGINEEVAALQATARPDIAGLALRLRALANNVGALPLVTTTVAPQLEAAADADAPAAQLGPVRTVLREIWHSLRNLVVVRQLSEPLPPLLPPEQEFFLRENLRLVLRGAELAALQGRDELFRAQLADARAWVTRYFDGDKEVVRMALAELDELAAMPLAASLPDIGGSLQALEQATRAETP